MATTMYTITANNELVNSSSKKAKAIELATAFRNEHGVSVVVATQNGTVVFEQAAPKKIKMSKPYTRVVELSEDFKPAGDLRVCYRKTRKGLTVLHDMSKLGEDDAYTVRDDTTMKAIATFATTRDCGRFTTDFARA